LTTDSKLMKNGLGARAVQRISSALAAAWPQFPSAKFSHDANGGLDALELKGRVRHIMAVMDRYLPAEFTEALDIVLAAGIEFPPGQPGDIHPFFAPWPLVDWVGENGVEHGDLTLSALRQLTPVFSAEFAVRPLIVAHQQETLSTLETWLSDPSEHVRRLVSEGTRPRLPWGQHLKELQADPRPVLSLLENLKNDPSEYVRKSVANNLNEISKDHPDLMLDVAEQWLQDATAQRRWIVGHACRTLIKKGDKRTLELLGYTTTPSVNCSLSLSSAKIFMGESLTIEVNLKSESGVSQNLMVDYIVHHMRAKGKTTPKVFKWKTVTIEPGKSVQFVKKHSFAPRSVRRYYPGEHAIEILVGGKTLARESFQLVQS